MEGLCWKTRCSFAIRIQKHQRIKRLVGEWGRVGESQGAFGMTLCYGSTKVDIHRGRAAGGRDISSRVARIRSILSRVVSGECAVIIDRPS